MSVLPDSDMEAAAIPLRRVAMIVEYDGTGYAGLQRQDHAPTIQGEIEKAASALGVLDPCFRASGRTDTGVHALGQVIALSLPERVAMGRPRDALNWHLPPAIRVRKAVPCSEEFDPRTDARLRVYCYRLATTPSPNPLWRHLLGVTRGRLDLWEMQRCAAQFVGGREMKAWRSAICQATRTYLHIDSATVEPLELSPATAGIDPCYQIRFAARSFLHHQVRLMVGAIILAGRGKLSPEELERHFSIGTRPSELTMAEARGLCLERVGFAEGKDPFE